MHHIAATTVATLFRLASIPVIRGNMAGEKLSQQVSLRHGGWSEAAAKPMASGMCTVSIGWMLNAGLNEMYYTGSLSCNIPRVGDLCVNDDHCGNGNVAMDTSIDLSLGC